MNVAAFNSRVLSCLKAPGHGDDTDLRETENGLYCPQIDETYPYLEGSIPCLFGIGGEEGRAITQRVRDFYEENPFPNYEGLEEFGSLVTKGRQSPFATALLGAIGYNKLVLECGCGTGQLSHFLQLNNNHVLGVDMSVASLGLALEHKRRNLLTRCSFAQMNIFDLAVKDSSFDVVISHGVLHHTFDARRAFAHIVRKVKPGGLVVVGLYNRYGRIPTWIRSKLMRVLGPNVDWVVRTRIRDATKAQTWINDQYHNPHETWHSIDEILGWFEENHVEFVNCYPPILGSEGEGAASLDTKTDAGNAYQRIITQVSWLWSISREGALFDLVGRRE